jgi:hypothetical protein
VLKREHKVLTTLTQIKLESEESVSHFAVRFRHLLGDAMRYGQPMTESSRIDRLLSAVKIGHRAPYHDFKLDPHGRNLWVDMGLHMSFGGIKISNVIDQSLSL